MRKSVVYKMQATNQFKLQPCWFVDGISNEISVSYLSRRQRTLLIATKMTDFSARRRVRSLMTLVYQINRRPKLLTGLHLLNMAEDGGKEEFS